MKTEQIRVMHVVDTLTAGGRERMAVNLANSLPRQRFAVYLCTTRYDGPLAEVVAADVGRLRLERTRRYDLAAARRLIAFNQANGIEILHAHDASIFLAALASLFPPFPAVIWHDHFGLYATEERPVWLYRLGIRRVRGVIAVNEPLARWSKQTLRVPQERVWYVPNFVCSNGKHGECISLPGSSGNRIVCVANLRAQKDHLTLLRAMVLVTRELPEAHLLLVGDATEPEYSKRVHAEIVRQGLEGNVSVLGARKDVDSILKSCDIGVLSSVSEGLPLSLIEYGMAGLPAVATDVGQCAEVLDAGRAGILVPSGSAEKLAEALLSLLNSPQRRIALGNRFRHRVEECHSPAAVMAQICRIYETALGLS
jgi:glycosyltransferase involved in cell wall biosynthesis